MADLLGSIEYCDGGFWTELVDVGSLFYRHSDLFGALFGVTNFANFQPLFAGRGLPDNTSDSLKNKYASAKSKLFGATWVLYSEIADVDWNYSSMGPDKRSQEFGSDRDDKVTLGEAIDGTRFPLVLNLMKCTAEEFGNSNVRLVVYFN